MPRTVYLIEDNPDIRMLVQAILEDDYRVVEFEDGVAALEALRRLPGDRDVIVLDISLPIIDGLEVLRLLRADPSLEGHPVVALTAHAMAGDRARFIAAGFDDYVSKPIVDANVLFRAIEHCALRS
jgi:CheY-like chemotaxis protein